MRFHNLTKSLPIPPAVRTLALLGLFAAPALAQTPEGSANPPAYSNFAGEYRVYVDGDTLSLGKLVVDASADATECGLTISSSPLGPGSLTPDGAEWHANFASGLSAVFFYDYGSARYEFELSGLGLSGFLAGSSCSEELIGPQDPQGQGPKGSIGSREQGRIDIWATWPPWLNPYIHTIDFCQFVTVHVWALRANPAGGPPTREELPAGTTMLGTGNGGGNASLPQIANGAGSVRVDGSTVYVDSATGGSPGYLAGGGAGDRGSGTCSMSDAPNIGPDQFGPALLGLPNPLEIVGLEIECDFTDYLVVDGQVIWVWQWSWLRTIRFDQGPPYPGGRVLYGPGVPASGFAPDDAAALSDFQNGGFHGAPNQ